MPQDVAQRIINQYSNLKVDRSGFENEWKSISDYALGRRSFMRDREVQGRKKNIHIFDATFQQAADALTAEIQSQLISSASQWFDLTPEDPRALEDEAAQLWYKDVTKTMFSAFNHPEGGFAPQSHEMLFDIVSFGTGGFFTGDVPGKGIFFSARPLSEIFVTLGAEGRTNGVFRRYFLKTQQAKEKFGDKAGPAIDRAFKNNDLLQEWEFVQAIMPRENSGGFGAKGMPIAAIDVNVDAGRIVNESGFHEMPYAVPMWSRDNGETYGRGPGLSALPTAKVLNRMQRTKLIAAEKASDPPLLVHDDGMISPVRTQPAGQNIIRSLPGGAPALQYLESRARVDITDNAIAAHQEMIRGFFYHELIQGSVDDPRMSATQVLELSGKTARRIGPMLFRLQVQWLEPTITRVFGLMSRAGMFPEAPPSVAGQNIKIDYVSPASRAQQNSEVQSVMGVFGAGIEWSQVDPDVLDNLDFDKGLRALGNAFPGVLDVIRTSADVRKIRDAKNQAAAAAAQQEQVTADAENLSKAAPALQAIQGGAA